MSESGIAPTVLVLDDEKNIRQSIDIALSQEGIRVVAAHDPASAMRALNGRIIDLLILDIKLGEIDGITFFKATQAAGLSVPALFISGNATLTQASGGCRAHRSVRFHRETFQRGANYNCRKALP